MNKQDYDGLTFNQLAERNAEHVTAIGRLEAQVKQLAAENAVKQEFISTCFRAAGDGGDMDGNDIQELGARLGLFERQTYQPYLHGYTCGHEAGEDSVYVMKASPATDAYAASLRAEGVEMLAAIAGKECKRYKSINDRAGLRKWKSIVIFCSDFAAQLRSKSEVQHD